MFTGIVEASRPVRACRSGLLSLELEVDLGELTSDVRVGDSIAVEGCCLTVASLHTGIATFHVMGETLEKTGLGALSNRSWVNVERALRVGDRLGGHFVSGHIDGIGVVDGIEMLPGQTNLRISVPEALFDLCIQKGSICFSGVSLTILGLDRPCVTVGLIPHTLAVTTLGRLQRGDRVNVEVDSIGKWVQKLMPRRDPSPLA